MAALFAKKYLSDAGTTISYLGFVIETEKLGGSQSRKVKAEQRIRPL